MGTEVALPKGFGAVSTVFGGANVNNDELGAGVSASYAVVGYRGKVWSLKYQGVETQLMRDDGDGPRNSIEVVIVKASPAVSKILYKNGYVEGSSAAPDCWSADGVKPSGSVQNKVHPTCADCPMNAWGSRVTESGKQGKACSDSRRVAVVPAQDLDNDLFGGPMLLRVPAASLKDLKAYGDLLSSYQYPYYGAVTRVSFDPKEAYPKFVFSAIRPLNDEEARHILSLRDDKRVATVLSEVQEVTSDGTQPAGSVPSSPFEEQAPPASPFEQPQVEQPQAAAKAETPPSNPFAAAAEVIQKEAPAAPAKEPEAPKAETKAAATSAVPDEGMMQTPDSFDSMLDSLIG